MSVADPTPNSTGSSQSCHRTLVPAQTPPASPQCMIPRFEFCRCSLLPLHSTDRCDLSTPSLGTSSWPRSVVPHPRKGLPGSGTKPRGVHGPKRGLWQLERCWATGCASLRPILLPTAGDLVRQPIHPSSRVSPCQPDLKRDPDDWLLTAAAAAKPRPPAPSAHRRQPKSPP